MHVDPSVKRESDEGCWVVFSPFPIFRDGNIQFQESHGEHHCQAVIGNQSVNERDSVEPRYYQTDSLCH
jgi:hypothetical protein